MKKRVYLNKTLLNWVWFMELRLMGTYCKIFHEKEYKFMLMLKGFKG